MPETPNPAVPWKKSRKTTMTLAKIEMELSTVEEGEGTPPVERAPCGHGREAPPMLEMLRQGMAVIIEKLEALKNMRDADGPPPAASPFEGS
jgi:hypothetical protein